MSLPTITAAAAKDLISKGAVLIDVRDASEHARSSIPGARLAPLSAGLTGLPGEGVVVFHCKSGMRTKANAHALQAATSCEAYILEDGLDGWQAAGLPIVEDKSKPLEIMRQVQITAGGLALAGAILGFAVHPGFHLLSGFIGAGLTFAGITGWCGMAKMLALMPWNNALPMTPAKA